MAGLKTKENKASVEKFLNGIKDEAARQDCLEIVKMMKQATKAEPKMWGPSIIGFGTRHLKYDSGRELDWMMIGFSPRKQNITLYGLGASKKHDSLLNKLGRHSTGKGCLYIKKLSDVDTKVLKELVVDSVQTLKKSAT